MRLCVFCGSSAGKRPEYAAAARTLGQLLASQRCALVYGGARVGLMGALADSALQHGGEVIGVIPRALVEREIAHTGVSDLRVVETMHERKALMAELADGFVALPGGVGTLDELFEVWTWAQLGLHRKPCGLLNVGGYYDELSDFLDRSVVEEFLKPEYRTMLVVERTPQKFLDRMTCYVPPTTTKWQQRISASWTPETIDVLAWVCVRDGRMLATRTRGTDRFYLPGGKRRPGESDWQALRREVHEELQLDLQAEGLSLVGIVEAPAYGHPVGTRVRMTCYMAEPSGGLRNLRAGAEVQELAWLTYSERQRCAPAAEQVCTMLHQQGRVT